MTQSSSPKAVKRGVNTGRVGFISLRAKFVLFFSLILILSCSTLSWYLIENRRAAMADNLQQLGTILLTNVVSNEHFRYAGLVAQDRSTLEEFSNGLMAVQDVVYVVVTGSDGAVLTQHTKGQRRSSASLLRSPESPLYPDSSIARRLLRTPTSTPQMTALSIVNVVSTRFAWEERVYDFAMPVARMTDATNNSIAPFSLQMEERSQQPSSTEGPFVSGLVQIGLSDASLNHELLSMVTNVILLTVFIITAGILGAHLLASRITTPLRSLASVAHQVAEGTLPQPLPSSTRDEVGELTQVFNMMTRALHERNLAITANMDTIRRQIGQLTTVHQTSAAISSTLNLNELMDTVLQLLMSNLGLSRMVLMLRHEDRDVAYVAQIAGVSEEIADAARHLTIPLKEDGTLIAELLIHAKPVLVTDITAVADRMHPAVLELARRVGVTSFVLVPLQIHNQTLGFLGGDRGEQPCTEEDLNILLTIASHVATAIDNARTYADLAQLTQTLEYRIQERTKELSIANEQLQEHDRRRTMFVSVASHELRTPMTAIRSFADNMLDGVAGALTERQKTYLNRIEHNLNRLTRIINQLLDWSRLDMNREVLRLEPLCIRQISTLVVESLRTVAGEKHVTIDIEAPEQLSMIHGDRDKLEQILWNIIGNAVKFTPPGGQVSVGFEPLPEGMVRVCVADTGCGISPEHLDEVFHEFSKIPSTMPGAQGAQLGLFITKSFVSMHRGRIWVESTLGAGTRFFFTLPFASSQEQSGQTSPKIVEPPSATRST
jgi:signal transduction histidine kinase/HAMP domain-containing protein